VPTANPDPYPPPFDKYLNSQAVTSKIGSRTKWEQTNFDVYDNFAATGDWMRTSLPDLEKVINAGVRTVIYDGDADYILNFNGVEAMVRVHSPHTSAASRLSP
jgi:carboxypeptidase C (cathepsin A)